jgi:toxin ParE1/3/4
MAESRGYRLYPLAQADLEEIWSYTASRWSPEQAESYHAAIVAAFEGLAAGSKQGRPSDSAKATSNTPSALISFSTGARM